MELRLMFCSEDKESRRAKEREKERVPFLRLSVQSVIGDGELGQSWRLIEEQLHTLSSLITGPVSHCSGPHSGILGPRRTERPSQSAASVMLQHRSIPAGCKKGLVKYQPFAWESGVFIL